MYEEDTIVLSPRLRERFVATVKERLPLKSFGYFISKAGGSGEPTDFVLFEDNIRNSEIWKGKFEAYGQYFIEHDDAGFVATPEEAWRVQKTIWARGMVEVGVFHSHLRHPANFSQIDYEMHTQRFGRLWHMTVSMRNPNMPQLRAFAASESGVRELRVVPDAAESEGRLAAGSSPEGTAHNEAIRRARGLLRLGGKGLPRCGDSREIFTAVEDLLGTGHEEAIEELLINGFLRDARHRFEEYVAGNMCPVKGDSYWMGTRSERARHFCGEGPSHPVSLSPFEMARVPVTNALFGLYDPKRLEVPAPERQHPVAGVTWFDAAVFALWMGCRLPTEAEWEFACGAGSEGEWCCADEGSLGRYAWYSENSGGKPRAVGTKEANSLGLFDLHGNVWEWCRDGYDQDYYSRSPAADPVNVSHPLAEKVCRGGSIHALSEMCRTRYRFHEPPDFMAADLGFRLARGGATTSCERRELWSNS